MTGTRGFRSWHTCCCCSSGGSVSNWEAKMNNVIYLVGLVVVVMAVLAFFGLR